MFFGPRTAQMMKPTFDIYAMEGYGQNPVVKACIEKITTAFASVDPILFRVDKSGKRVKVEEGDLVKLIARPNATQSWRQFVKSLGSYYLIGGNGYVLGTGIDEQRPKPPNELYLLNPRCVTVKENREGVFPLGFEYQTAAGTKTTYPVNRLNGMSAILQVKTFNPVNQWYGMPPMLAAAAGVDIFNAGQTWNLSLLQNEARPSGAMVMTGQGPDAKLGDDQFLRMREQIDSMFSGAGNAGRPLLLEGGLDWKQMSMSAKDMDHMNNMLTAARFIASVFGVPPQLLGIPGDSTYANYEQAIESFWMDTVLPLLGFILDEFNRWLVPLYGEGYELWYDEDMIPALEAQRKQKGERINTSGYLTIEEKRRAMGYPEKWKEGETLLVPSSNVPVELAGAIDLPEPGSEVDEEDDEQ